jgi:hypothetical protein
MHFMHAFSRKVNVPAIQTGEQDILRVLFSSIERWWLLAIYIFVLKVP